MWFNDKKGSKSRTFCGNTVVGVFPVIVIIVQILVEMCLYGAC